MKRLLLMFLVCYLNNVLAFDFGKRATTFEIKEEGFVAMMKRKLAGIDLEKEQKKMTEIANERVNNPSPVEGIKPATENRKFWYDPTYMLAEDAVLPCGKVLHKAGTKVNPLEYSDLDRRLFFVDAREEEQIEWLVDELKRQGDYEGQRLEDRIILIGGSVLKLKEELGDYADQIYFDQFGELTKKFGIKASPAKAWQESLKLAIEEIVL